MFTVIIGVINQSGFFLDNGENATIDIHAISMEPNNYYISQPRSLALHSWDKLGMSDLMKARSRSTTTVTKLILSLTMKVIKEPINNILAILTP